MLNENKRLRQYVSYYVIYDILGEVGDVGENVGQHSIGYDAHCASRTARQISPVSSSATTGAVG